MSTLPIPGNVSNLMLQVVGCIRSTETTMTSAIIQAMNMWKNGQLNGGKPDSKELKLCMEYLGDPPFVVDEEQIRFDLACLIKYNVGRHFNSVATHRVWVGLVYELLQIAESHFLEDCLRDKIQKHDLSRYGAKEVLGHSIMFGQTGTWRSLCGIEQEVWVKSTVNHYKANPHHPQYYGDLTMPIADLEQSIIDMLACRFQRDLKSLTFLTAGTIMDIPGICLTRYKPKDQVMVINIISNWSASIQNLIMYPTENQLDLLQHWQNKAGYTLFQPEQID